MVLVLTSKAGGCRLFSGLLYWKIQRVRRLSYVRNIFSVHSVGLFDWYCDEKSLSALGALEYDPASCLVPRFLADCDYHNFVPHRLVTQPALFTDGASHIVDFQIVCFINLLDQQHTIASVSIRTGKRLFRC